MTPLLSTALLRTQSDARLASLARDGHELAFEAIVERYRRPLHAYCRRVLPDARAEDVVQQTFLSAWTALERGEDVRELRAWLYRIAHNAAINNVKRAGYDYDELRDSLEHADTPADDLERRAVIRETLAGVAALPERQREALLRTAVEGSSQAEIARDLGLTDGAVRQLVHRARATLRTAVTAITPWPLAAWAATAGAAGGPVVSERIGELAAGAGTAGIGGLLVKGGAAVVVAGAIAAPAAVHDVRSDSARAASRPAGTSKKQAHVPVQAATPVSRTITPSVADKRKDSGKTGGSDDASRGDAGRGGDGRKEQSGRNGSAGDGQSGSGRSGGGDHGESVKPEGDDHGGSPDEEKLGSRQLGGEDRRGGRDDSSGPGPGSKGDAAPVVDDETPAQSDSGSESDGVDPSKHSGSVDPLPHD